MKKTYNSWKSPSTGKEMEMLIYGKKGTPVILFPSAHGSFDEWESRGAFETLSSQVEEGYNQFFCIESFASESFLNDSVDSAAKMRNFNLYQQYVTDELLPFIARENSNPYIIVAGVSLGAYAVLLMALKHPESFQKVVGICGYYDINVHLDDVPGDSVYFNNPVEFIPNLTDQRILRKISSVDIRLLNYKNDPTRKETKKMSDLLWLKFIEHEHYVWEEETEDLWKLVPLMLKDNLF